jgi:CubicO group peptidase (beta-lactamase class C family)
MKIGSNPSMEISIARGLLITVLLCCCNGANALSTPDEVGTAIDQLRLQHGVAAVAVVLVDREHVLLARNYGFKDWAGKTSVTDDTRFRAGSITKSFTALAVMRAQARHLLDINQPLRTLAPGASFENPWEQSHPLTLAHLLEHTAGWRDMSKAEFDSSDPKPLTINEALVLAPASRMSRWEPGTRYEYSNSGAGLVSYVLEKVTHQRFETFMQQEVFAPLGMKSASLIADPDTLAHLAQGYDSDGRTPLLYWHILYRAAAGLNLLPRDMAAFLQMLLNRGKVGEATFLSPADIERMEYSHTLPPAEDMAAESYGLGIRRYPHRGHLLYGHGGDADGYLSQYAYSLESGRGFFVCITAFNDEAMDAVQGLAEDWLTDGILRN